MAIRTPQKFPMYPKHPAHVDDHSPAGLVTITKFLPLPSFSFFRYSTSGTYHWHPPAISYNSNEQCHTPPRKGWGVWVWVSGWQGLCQFLLLLWGLPDGSVAARQDTHPHRQNGLLRPHLLPHRLLPLQPGLLGVIPVPLRAVGNQWYQPYSLDFLERWFPRSTWSIYDALYSGL